MVGASWLFRSHKKMDLVQVPMYSGAMKRQGLWQFDFASGVGNENLPSAPVIAQLQVFISCVQALEKNLNKDVLLQPRVRRCCSSVAFGSKCQFGGIRGRPVDFSLEQDNAFAKFVQTLPKKNPFRVCFKAWYDQRCMCFVHEGCCFTSVKQQPWSRSIGRMVSKNTALWSSARVKVLGQNGTFVF